MTEIYIPAKTQEKLNAVHPKGTRHQAKIEIALPLLGAGIPATAVQQTLHEKFPEATLNEIENVIRWCLNHNPQPAGYGRTATGGVPMRFVPPPTPKRIEPARSASDQCDWWLNGKKTTPEELSETSPIKFKGTPKEELIVFCETLYAPEQKLNIVCKFTLKEDGKACPKGCGKTMTCLEWCDYFRRTGVPQSEAGAWLRMNPCGPGTGAGGAVTDADITAWKFMLLESDTVPAETLIALFQNLRLPISAILKSGGKSIHAWVRVEASDEKRYSELVRSLLEILAPFGLDKANKNPSRLSRLPSAKRVIQAHGDGMQSLLWLNPMAKPVTEKEIKELETRLSVPLADERPMLALIHQSISRYSELYENRGKLGVQVGLRDFDRDTGGFKAGQMTVIAAETNKGKSTTALNLIHGAIQRGHGVALFTLEMDREEIMDLIIANHCGVNRNAFNTGYFSDDDFPKITLQVDAISKFPLWIFDDASITVEEICKRVELLKNDGKLDLVVVDYVQIVSHPDTRMPREQQVAEIARSIRILAKRTKLPFVVLSQLNDDGKLRESRVVGHEAHNVITLEPNDDETEMNLKVVKGRRIMKKEYNLIYEPRYARIYQRPLPTPDEDRNPTND